MPQVFLRPSCAAGATKHCSIHLLTLSSCLIPFAAGTCWAWRRRRFRAASVRGGGAGAARRRRISHETGIILFFVQVCSALGRRHMLGMAAPQVFVPPACAAGAQALLDGAAAVSGHDMPCRLQPLDVRFLPEQCSICQGLSR